MDTRSAYFTSPSSESESFIYGAVRERSPRSSSCRPYVRTFASRERWSWASARWPTFRGRISESMTDPQRVALVTGAGRGIGRATAEAFAAQGWAVVIAELRPTLGRRVERMLTRTGVPALFVPTDVASPRSVEHAVRAALRRFRRLDCVVNNAGVLTAGPLGRLALSDLELMLAVNLRGTLLMSRTALRALRRQGEW